MKESPFKFVIKHQPMAKKFTLVSKREKQIPDDFAIVAGDIVHNLCSALDHAVYGMACDKATSPFELMFPFVRKPESLESRIKSTQVHFAGTYVVETIRALQPYPRWSKDYAGGNEILSGLHRLDTRDKHRLLILTARAADIPSGELNRVFPGTNLSPFVGPSNFVRVAHTDDEEMPIYEMLGVDYSTHIRDVSDADFEKITDFQPAFRVTFGDGQPFESQPVVAQLNACANYVEKVVGSLIEAFLSPKNVR